MFSGKNHSRKRPMRNRRASGGTTRPGSPARYASAVSSLGLSRKQDFSKRRASSFMNRTTLSTASLRSATPPAAGRSMGGRLAYSRLRVRETSI